MNQMREDLDTQYMLQFKNGDTDGFRILFTKYTKKIVNFCFRFCGDKEIAEELAQEVFLRVYKAAPRYQPEAKFSTWLFRIATNVCLNEIRKSCYHVKKESIDSPCKTGSGEVQREIEEKREKQPQELMEKKNRDIMLQQAMSELPIKQRTALILRIYNELSYKEIGKQIKSSENGVKSLIHRARHTLVKLMKNSNRSI